MLVFVCALRRDADRSRVALPAHAHQEFGHELLPSLVEPGTYAVEPAHSGAPWRRWEGGWASRRSTRKAAGTRGGRRRSGRPWRTCRSRRRAGRSAFRTA
ncbi:hypothetical protein GCM10010492_57500 [Saccharothrix mutabilis subsp. mutabilis]|uniref:Uncharacterized protein n=1 Tax=Saccharothrix mutabilis subsp. mutabilis TaxID=66855 RepID=A0ABN0UGL0_9PSEU